jgi:hypothetical protein
MRRYPTGEVIARSLLAAAAVATVAACGAQSSGSAVSSGLYGTVRVSPASPICVGGSSCTKPARHFKFTFSAGGRTVSVTTDARGHYRVRLAHGRYAVRGHPGPAGNVAPKSGITPSVVVVPAGRFARSDFVYDSGIR